MTKRNILIVLWVTISASLALVVASSGMPSPVQSMEWGILQSVKHDGVNATNVDCMQVPVGPSLDLDFLNSGAFWNCRVDIHGAPSAVVSATLYDDGSWNLDEDDRP